MYESDICNICNNQWYKLIITYNNKLLYIIIKFITYIYIYVCDTYI